MVDKLSKSEKLFVKYPDSVRFVRLAAQCLDNGRHEDAILLCEKGCEKHKNSALGYYMLAMSYFNKGDFERAYQASIRSKSLLPDNPSGLKLHAEICSILGNLADAINNFRHAYRLDPFGESVSEKVKELESKIITEPVGLEASHRVEEYDQDISRTENSTNPSLASFAIVHTDSELVIEPNEKRKPNMKKGDGIIDGNDPEERQSNPSSIESRATLTEGHIINKTDYDGIVTPEDLVAQSINSAYADTGQVEKCEISRIFDANISEPRTSFAEEGLGRPKSDNSDELQDIGDFPVNSLVEDHDKEKYSAAEAKREQNLFHLFQEIETGSGGVVDVALLPDKEEYKMSDNEKNISTRTLADIYILQGLTDKAIEIYEKLLEDDPGNVRLLKKLSVLRSAG